MKPSTFRLLERSTLIVTGFALGGVGGLAVLTGNLELLAVFAVASLMWLPAIGPYLGDMTTVDQGALDAWVEVSRRRVEYVYVDGSYARANDVCPAIQASELSKPERAPTRPAPSGAASLQPHRTSAP